MFHWPGDPLKCTASLSGTNLQQKSSVYYQRA